MKGFDTGDAGSCVQMLVLPPVLAFGLNPGRFLEMKFESVQLSDRVESLPRFPEPEAELLVVADRAREIVDKELRREGCHARLCRVCGHCQWKVCVRLMLPV